MFGRGAIISATFLTVGCLFAQQKGRPTRTAPSPRLLRLPGDFAEVFEKVFQASEGEFKSIRGAPLPGADGIAVERDRTKARTHEFRWKTTLPLPAAKTCEIKQAETTYDMAGKGSAKQSGQAQYQCGFMGLGIKQILPGIQAALGTGWTMGTDAGGTAQFTQFGSPYGPRVIVSGDDATVFLGVLSPYLSSASSFRADTPEIAKLKAQIELLQNSSASRSPGASSTGPDDADVAAAIARIGASQHSPLPAMQAGSARGPITVQNETAASLTVYFSGTVNRKEIIPARARRVLVLSPGTYKVAGELSDKSVLPFFGVRNYSGGETETFYVQPR